MVNALESFDRQISIIDTLKRAIDFNSELAKLALDKGKATPSNEVILNTKIRALENLVKLTEIKNNVQSKNDELESAIILEFSRQTTSRIVNTELTKMSSDERQNLIKKMKEEIDRDQSEIGK